MDKWKEQTKEYAIYCREEQKETWIKDIDALNLEDIVQMNRKWSKETDALNIANLVYEDKKNSYMKTAEIMKCLEDGESWKEIADKLLNEQRYFIGITAEVAHMMLTYSKHGIEFVQTIFGDNLEFHDELRKEFYEALEKEKKKGSI